MLVRLHLWVGALLLSSCALQHAEKCIATVLYPAANGKPCIIEFRANGKREICFGPRQRLLARGERFTLVYNKYKPWKNQLLTENPLFLPDEATEYAEAKVIRCISGDYSRVTFSFKVNGRSYKKLQLVKGPLALTKQKECIVRYSTADPARSILIVKPSTSID